MQIEWGWEWGKFEFFSFTFLESDVRIFMKEPTLEGHFMLSGFYENWARTKVNIKTGEISRECVKFAIKHVAHILCKDKLTSWKCETCRCFSKSFTLFLVKFIIKSKMIRNKWVLLNGLVYCSNPNPWRQSQLKLDVYTLNAKFVENFQIFWPVKYYRNENYFVILFSWDEKLFLHCEQKQKNTLKYELNIYVTSVKYFEIFERPREKKLKAC